MDNKQKVIDNLINLLSGVNTKRDETNFSCKSLQIKNSSEKASHIDETISFNRFSMAQNKNKLNVAKEQLIAAPSDTSTNKLLRIFKIVILLATTSTIIAKKKAIYPLKRNNMSKDKLITPS